MQTGDKSERVMPQALACQIAAIAKMPPQLPTRMISLRRPITNHNLGGNMKIPLNGRQVVWQRLTNDNQFKKRLSPRLESFVNWTAKTCENLRGLQQQRLLNNQNSESRGGKKEFARAP